MSDQRYDAVVIGAGAAGLFCAGIAGQRGLSVLVLDHAAQVAEKIRISGGGRCNFTNRDAAPAHFASANPHYCRSALARYTPRDFIDLVQRHGIGWHEKHKGQLFCNESSQAIIDLLLRECAEGRVVRRQPCAVRALRRTGDDFELDTDAGPVLAAQVVVATGGLSIPKIGATDFGYRIARQFDIPVVPTRPALVPLVFDGASWTPFAGLAGLALQVGVTTGSGRARAEFAEDLLFTHRGLSGPAILQISTYWQPGEPLCVDLAPEQDLAAELADAKQHTQRQLATQLAEWMPRRLADAWLSASGLPPTQTLPECRNADLARLAERLQRWQIVPTGTEGYRKAEVTAGGVDTRQLSSQTMESRRVTGLHFIGEVVDVTGWLGGYNFQWAWASAAACAQSLRKSFAAA